MKQRLAAPSEVIDLAQDQGSRGVELSGDTLTIKAATTHYDIMPAAPTCKKAIPALAHLPRLIGDPAVRYRGTIGGSIANNDPAADYPAAVLALGATVNTNKRTIAADEFFKGLFTTALEDGEIITAVAFPIPAKAGYAKIPQPGLALRDDRRVRGQDQGRRCPRRRHRRSQNGVMRVPAIEAALKANWSAAALDGVKISGDGMMTTSTARRTIAPISIKVMAQRAVTAAG